MNGRFATITRPGRLPTPTLSPSKSSIPTNVSTDPLNNNITQQVQLYCLMGVRGAYTDWHVDFGGSSVWYNVLQVRLTVG